MTINEIETIVKFCKMMKKILQKTKDFPIYIEIREKQNKKKTEPFSRYAPYIRTQK